MGSAQMITAEGNGGSALQLFFVNLPDKAVKPLALRPVYCLDVSVVSVTTMTSLTFLTDCET